MANVWAKGFFLAIALVAVITLVLVARDDAEFSRVSLPCWLTSSSCDDQLPKAEAAQRWAGETKKAPCALSGDCDLPSRRDAVSRWKKENEAQERAKLRRDQGIARRNHLPIPTEDRSKPGTQHYTETVETIQQELQRKLLRQAIDRANAVSAQAKQMSTGKIVAGKPVAKGLLKTGAQKIALLKDHPKSQRHIGTILSKVQEAEKAKAQAAKATAKALKLKQAAVKAQKHAVAKATKAAHALSKAKADEAAHKKALRKVQHTKERVRFAKDQVKTAARDFKSEVPAATPKKATLDMLVEELYEQVDKHKSFSGW
jgi:hypothetical protein